MKNIKDALRKNFTEEQLKEWYELDIVDTLYRKESRFQWEVESNIIRAIEEIKQELNR